MTPLRVDADGRLKFASTDPNAERAAISALRERRRMADERLYEQNLAYLGVTDDPTSGNRSVLHEVKNDKEEALWRAWHGYSVG